MSDNPKPAQNAASSFELADWLDKTDRLDGAATPGPWEDRRDDLTDWMSVVHDQEFVTFVAETGKGTEKWAVADAEWIAHARTALPAAVAALRAVLDLHAPDREWGHICGHCTDFDTYGSEWIDYPCPTIQAIQQHLT